MHLYSIEKKTSWIRSTSVIKPSWDWVKMHLSGFTFILYDRLSKLEYWVRPKTVAYAHTLPIHCIYIAHAMPIHCPHISHTLSIHCLYITHTLPIHFSYIAHTLPIHCPYIAHTMLQDVWAMYMQHFWTSMSRIRMLFLCSLTVVVHTSWRT